VISFWERQQWFNNIDFFIIGAGFTGLFCALAIRKKYPDAKIVVAERHPIAHGASTKNAGFACFGSLGEILDDLMDETLESTLNRVVRRYEGLQKLRSIIPASVCEFEETGGYELFRTNEQTDFNACLIRLEEINEALRPRLGFAPYSNADIQSFGFSGITSAIHIEREGMLHPGKAIAYLHNRCAAANIALLFGIEIQKINSGTSEIWVESTLGEFNAKKVILATNAFTSTFLGEASVKPARGQVLITSPIAGLPFKGTFHMDKGFYYFRNVGNRVLLGGARNVDFEGETTSAIALNQQIQSHLEETLRNHILPNRDFTIEQRWSGIMAFGHAGEKEPVVAEVQPNIFAAYRLGGMGVALSAQVADEVAALV
jgi:glycine/D-amino acid oxidase-like deaminating enzyme